MVTITKDRFKDPTDKVDSHVNESGLHLLKKNNTKTGAEDNNNQDIKDEKKITEIVMEDMRAQSDITHIEKLLGKKQYHESIGVIKELMED